MRPIIITLHIDAATAAREGHCAAGPQRLELTAADMAALTERQRETLARHLERRTGYGEPLTKEAKPIGHADVTVLAALLDARAAAMAFAESIGLAELQETPRAGVTAERLGEIDWPCDCPPERRPQGHRA